MYKAGSHSLEILRISCMSIIPLELPDSKALTQSLSHQPFWAGWEQVPPSIPPLGQAAREIIWRITTPWERLLPHKKPQMKGKTTRPFYLDFNSVCNWGCPRVQLKDKGKQTPKWLLGAWKTVLWGQLLLWSARHHGHACCHVGKVEG